MASVSNFELISELQATARRDFYVADTTVLNPVATNPLIEGEWLELDSSYKLKRGSSAGIVAVYPVHTERGRYDTQALGKVNVVMLQDYEAETKIVNISSLVVGSPLKVGDVTIGGQTKRGLLLSANVAGSGDVVVGFVTKLYGATVQVRFQRTPARVL